MDYNDLKIIAERKKITIKELSDAIGMTSTGLKRSIEGESMSMKTVRELCKIMEISIAEFFGEEPVQAPSVASERVPYSFNAVPKNGTTPTTVETLVSHIAWLQDEIDRLRSSAQKGKKSA